METWRLLLPRHLSSVTTISCQREEAPQSLTTTTDLETFRTNFQIRVNLQLTALLVGVGPA